MKRSVWLAAFAAILLLCSCSREIPPETVGTGSQTAEVPESAGSKTEEEEMDMTYGFSAFTNVTVTGTDLSRLSEEERSVLYVQARYCQAMTDADIDVMRQIVSENENRLKRRITMENVKLNNGLECPVVGIGTFMLSPADAENSVREALKMGYRLIDTANAYVNERAVGRGMKASGVARGEIFLSTKLWPSEYENPNAVEETLERLGVDYVDLLYIHQPAGNWLAGYLQLEKAYREGKAKAIGISNFEGKYIAELETEWEIAPQFIQVEAHPYFTQKELRVTLDKYGIKLMSWYPLGHGDKTLINEPIFAELGKKYGKTSAQVILRWHTQMGFVVIPGSKNVDHIRDNLDILDFALTDAEMAQIAKLDKNERYYHRTDAQLDQFAAWKPGFEKK